LFRSFAPGFDTLYVRFYAKWPSATGLQYHHSGIQIQGYNPVSEWPQGFAGNAPDGNDHFATAIECGGTDTRKLYFYTYWKDMKSYNNSSSFYGNRFLGGLDSWNGVDLTVDTTEWVCIELMVKTNTPVTSSNGEQALWVNGELVYHVCDTAKGRWSGGDLWTPFGRTLDTFPGFQWRTTGNLKINMIGLQHYLEVEPKADFMYYDDVVVAKEYIGPIWNGSLAISKNAGISLIQYKNPVLLQNGYLFMNVSSDKSYRLSIYTPSGRTVYKQRFSGNKVFNAGRYFSNGNYIVNIQAEGYKIHKKIVIK
ncbi:MAG: T9SS type A sorting domain-containing protein, partial [Chitinispirillia bacterium]